MKEVNLKIELSDHDQVIIDRPEKSYMHLSIDEINEVHLECDTAGMLFVAENVLVAYSGIKGKMVLSFKDKLPRYWREMINRESTPKYQHSILPTPNLEIINTDCFLNLQDYVCKPGNLNNKTLQKLTSKNNESIKPINMSNISKIVRIPDLKPNEYPNINKHKDGFLWTRIVDDKAYIIGNTRGLGFLLKHLIYNCYIGGEQGSGFHKHLERNLGDLDSFSMDLGIYNIDFTEEKFRKDYYKYR